MLIDRSDDTDAPRPSHYDNHSSHSIGGIHVLQHNRCPVSRVPSGGTQARTSVGPDCSSLPRRDVNLFESCLTQLVQHHRKDGGFPRTPSDRLDVDRSVVTEHQPVACAIQRRHPELDTAPSSSPRVRNRCVIGGNYRTPSDIGRGEP